MKGKGWSHVLLGIINCVPPTDILTTQKGYADHPATGMPLCVVLWSTFKNWVYCTPVCILASVCACMSVCIHTYKHTHMHVGESTRMSSHKVRVSLNPEWALWQWAPEIYFLSVFFPPARMTAPKMCSLGCPQTPNPSASFSLVFSYQHALPQSSVTSFLRARSPVWLQF